MSRIDVCRGFIEIDDFIKSDVLSKISMFAKRIYRCQGSTVVKDLPLEYLGMPSIYVCRASTFAKHLRLSFTRVALSGVISNCSDLLDRCHWK